MDGKHILVVEDDCLANLALCELLQDCGYRTESAYCAVAALAAIRRRPPAALITDLDLGKGDTGFEIARFARWADPTMPVLYVSGQVDGRFPRDGVDGSQFLAKPYRADRIIAALRGLIEASAPPLPSIRGFASALKGEALPCDLTGLADHRLYARSKRSFAHTVAIAALHDLPTAFRAPSAAVQPNRLT